MEVDNQNRTHLLQLQESAQRVRSELFWKDLMDQVGWARERAIQKVTEGEFTNDEGRSVLVFLDMLSKMTQGVEVRLKQLEDRAAHSERQQVWRDQLAATRRR